VDDSEECLYAGIQSGWGVLQDLVCDGLPSAALGLAQVLCTCYEYCIALYFIEDYGFSSRSDANVRSMKGYRGSLAASQRGSTRAMRSKFAVFGPKCGGHGVVVPCLDSVQHGCRFGRHGVSGWVTERIHLALRCRLLEHQLVPLLRLLRQRLANVLATLLLTGLARFTSELT